MTMCDCNQGRLPCTCKPAEQHQGEPVEVLGYSVKGNRYAIRLTKAELVELHAEYAGDALIELVDRRHLVQCQSEVERLRRELDNANVASNFHKQNCEELRSQQAKTEDKLCRSLQHSYEQRQKLAERDALLARVVNSGALTSEQYEALEVECCALSASAQPVADVNFDLERMKAAVQGPMAKLPDGITREQFAGFMKMLVSETNFSTGTCCCGDPVESHGMLSGHAPTDEGDYAAFQLLQKIDDILNATAPTFGPDTVVCRKYELNGRIFYHYDRQPIYNSVPVTIRELLEAVRGGA